MKSETEDIRPHCMELPESRPAGQGHFIVTGDLAFGEGKTEDPRQGLIRVDPGPWERTVCQSGQSLRDDALRAMQAGQKNTRRYVNPVGSTKPASTSWADGSGVGFMAIVASWVRSLRDR